ncbi:luciferase family protein [Salinirubrum litoreum]|uniref:Luciferase family protein n=1 Tax=Salinirubrum litoreum TaxID=1126234 RepID=A0ABD5R9R1_9EURY
MSDEAIDRILRRVATWPGVTITEPGATPTGATLLPEQDGGASTVEPPVEGSLIRIDENVVAGVRADGLLDVPVDRRLRDQLLTEGRADRHPVAPSANRVSYRIGGPADVSGAMWLLRVVHLAHCCRTARLSPSVVSRRTRLLRLSPELARLVHEEERLVHEEERLVREEERPVRADGDAESGDATTSPGAADGRQSVPPRHFRD